MKKRGIFFSTDALVALMIIFLSMLVIYPVVKYSKHESYIQSDIIKVLSSLKMEDIMKDINNPYLVGLNSSGKITNLNNSLLEQIGEFYVTNISAAKDLAEAVLDDIDEKENVGIWYDDNLIFSKNTSSFETAENIEIDRQIISGIEKGKNTIGFVAKAWIKKISEKETSLFVKGDLMCGGWRSYSWGEYCATTATTAVYKVNIPENAIIENAWWLTEGAWTPQFSKLYINENLVFEGNINFYQIVDITNYLNPGENTARLEGNIGADDGASHIVVDYTTPDMETFEQQKIFYFNELETKSILHYEKALFIPTEISEINISLNASLDATLSFRTGAQTFEIGKKDPVDNIVSFSNNEIENSLSANGILYSDLNNEYFYFILDIGKDNPGQTTVLGGDSYIYINSSEIDIPYGSIDINGEIPLNDFSNHVSYTFYRNLSWEFYLPTNAIPIMADWQFGWFITSETSQKVIANSFVLYNSPPDDFISIFARFGYTPAKLNGIFKEGVNNFSLEFGNGYSVSTEASYGYLSYFVKSYVNYGEPKEKGKGGTKIIEFEDGTTRQLIIGDPNDDWNATTDALDDAIERLIQQLDTNGNGKIDLILDEESFDVNTLDISGVPYMWSTEIQVRKWH